MPTATLSIRAAGPGGAFSACQGIIHGFENSWGPFLDLEHDQPGLEYLLLLRRFVQECVPFADLRSAAELLGPVCGDYQPGHAPLAIATPERNVVAVYLPVGGAVELALPAGRYGAEWFDPLTGNILPAEGVGRTYSAPCGEHEGYPQDWTLILKR